MKYARALAFAAAAAITVVTATGCAVARNQQTAGSYIDDAGITTAVKAKMAEDKTVSVTILKLCLKWYMILNKHCANLHWLV